MKFLKAWALVRFGGLLDRLPFHHDRLYCWSVDAAEYALGAIVNPDFGMQEEDLRYVTESRDHWRTIATQKHETLEGVARVLDRDISDLRKLVTINRLTHEALGPQTSREYR